MFWNSLYIVAGWVILVHTIGGIIRNVPNTETYLGFGATALFFIAYELSGKNQ